MTVKCAMGTATAYPCPRPATEYVERDDRPDMCGIHARILALQEAASTIELELHRLNKEDRLERGLDYLD